MVYMSVWLWFTYMFSIEKQAFFRGFEWWWQCYSSGEYWHNPATMRDQAWYILPRPKDGLGIIATNQHWIRSISLISLVQKIVLSLFQVDESRSGKALALIGEPQ